MMSRLQYVHFDAQEYYPATDKTVCAVLTTSRIFRL